MLDKYITPVIKPLINPIVCLLDKRQISADQLTVTGFIIGMLASGVDCYYFKSFI